LVVAYIEPEPVLYQADNVVYDVIEPKAQRFVAESEDTTVVTDGGVFASADEDFDYTEWGCSCMRYLTRVKGLDIRGNARDVEPNSPNPIPGGVIIFRYRSGVAHASFLEYTLPNGNYYVSEWNFKKCQYTERVIKPDDPAIYGFYYVNPNKKPL